MNPVVFKIMTTEGPEYVAAYPVGELMVHRRFASKMWGVSHSATGYAMPLESISKDDAMGAAKVIDQAADWSVLRMGEDGKPDWKHYKPDLADAAKKGLAYLAGV